MDKNHKASINLGKNESLPNKQLHNKEGGVALYVHLPYCVKKCRYCDFNSYAYTNQNIEEYLSSLLLEARSRAWQLKPTTLFIGGGTPTLLGAKMLSKFLGELNHITGFCDSANEATIEANPESFDFETASAIRDCGINRLSLGFQSLRNDVLLAYDRVHDVQQSYKAFDWARKAGFDNINVDLIYSFPGQKLADWQDDLLEIHKLAPEHLSCYELSYEPGTSLTKLKDAGRHSPNSNEHSAAMFKLTRQLNSAAGFHPYEVSAFAKQERRCSHNMAYWNSKPYVGLGAGAASWLNPERLMNIASPEDYIHCINNNKNHYAQRDSCSSETILFDALMMGLRLEKQGVSVENLKTLSGLDPLEYYSEQWARFKDEGKIKMANKNGQTFIRATPTGFLHLDSILAELLPDDQRLSV
ncbi:MAG: radical SAM family heme chaperone HemW [Planctomycetes bacterium]|nr:radical SAM family heme chaperone HemW [Planctomycetota bacterium]